MTAKIGRRLTTAVWAVAAVLFISSLAMFEWFIQNRPSTPQPEMGYLKPINNHGSFHYVTAEEDLLHDTLDALTGGSILLAIILSWKYKKQN